MWKNMTFPHLSLENSLHNTRQQSLSRLFNSQERLKHVEQLQENQFLRIQLYRAKNTISDLQITSDTLYNKVREFKTEKGNYITIHEPETARRSSQTISRKCYLEIMEMIENYSTQIKALCQQFEQYQSRTQHKQIKTQQIQKQNYHICSKILNTCDQKLSSAESVLSNLSKQCQNKEKVICELNDKIKKTTLTLEKLAQKQSQATHKNNRLSKEIQSLKQQLQKKQLSIVQVNKNDSEGMKRYQSLLLEYDKAKSKAEWYEQAYEEKRAQMGKKQEQNLKKIQQLVQQNHSLTNNYKSITEKNGLLSRSNNRKDSQIEKLQQQNKQMKIQLQQLLQSQNDKLIHIQQKQKQLEHLRQLRNSQQTEKQQLTKKIEELQNDMTVIIEQLKVKQLEVSKLEHELNMYQNSWQNQSEEEQENIGAQQNKISTANVFKLDAFRNRFLLSQRCSWR